VIVWVCFGTRQEVRLGLSQGLVKCERALPGQVHESLSHNDQSAVRLDRSGVRPLHWKFQGPWLAGGVVMRIGPWEQNVPGKRNASMYVLEILNTTHCTHILPSEHVDSAGRGDVPMLPIKFRILLIAAIAATPAPARAYDEHDFLGQSKICEAATRLPWGDVNYLAWSDCMRHQSVRSPERRPADDAEPKTPWYSAYSRSLLDATDEGCYIASEKQPSDPPGMRRSDVSSKNRAWNICMEQHGILASPTQQQRRLPDFRAMAAEQRTVSIVNDYHYGCYTQDRYDQLSKDSILASTGALLTSGEDVQKRTHELVAASSDCRLWNIGDRVQVKAESEDLLCLAPVGSTDRCYWTEKNAITAWEVGLVGSMATMLAAPIRAS
jgi:hypothetical protein